MKVFRFDQIDDSFFTYKDYQQDVLAVKAMIEEVKENRDLALIEISKKNNANKYKIELTKEEIANCISKVPVKTEKLLKQVIKYKLSFDKKQFECLKELEYDINGSIIGHKIVPLKTVGVYVSYGKNPMPLSAIMTIVPAKVAGVKEVILCSSDLDNVTVMAAVMSGVDRIFNVGGAHAIAAMAYGTETIPSVDKIIGSGNKSVAQAKKEVYGKCGIDFLYNASELIIIADESSNADCLTSDIISQAEHDTEATSILITTSDKLAKTVLIEIKKQLANLLTNKGANISLENSYMILVDSLDQAINIANKKAPSQLKLCFDNATQFINAFRNFGSLFIGNYSTISFNDYTTGINNILPSNNISRYHGCLSVFDFVKIQTYQHLYNNHFQNSLTKIASCLENIEKHPTHNHL